MGSDPTDSDSADRRDGQQQTVGAGLLAQDLQDVQNQHRDPGDIHGADHADYDRDIADAGWPLSHLRPSARSCLRAASGAAESWRAGWPTGWNPLGRVSSRSTAMTSVAALTANGRTAARPNSQPPAAGPASSLPTICPAITRALARSRSAESISRGMQVTAAVSRSADPTPVVNAVRYISASPALWLRIAAASPTRGSAKLVGERCPECGPCWRRRRARQWRVRNMAMCSISPVRMN